MSWECGEARSAWLKDEEQFCYHQSPPASPKALRQSCLVISELVKAACKVELKMPLAVIVFRRPCAMLVRWETFVLLEVTCDKAELPGSVFFILKCSEMLRIVSEEPASYSLGNFSILS